MKKAVLVVGAHWAGKSVTINHHLKPMLNREDGETMRSNDRIFVLNELWGYILSQSFEEALKEFLEHSERYFRYNLLVFAGRPETEPGSKIPFIREALENEGYEVTIVRVQKGDDYDQTAQEIFDALNSSVLVAH